MSATLDEDQIRAIVRDELTPRPKESWVIYVRRNGGPWVGEAFGSGDVPEVLVNEGDEWKVEVRPPATPKPPGPLDLRKSPDERFGIRPLP